MDLFSLCDRYIQLSTFILFLVTHFCIFYIWFLPSYFDFCFVGERFGVQASSQKLELVTYYPSPHLFYPTPHPHISYTCSNSLIHPNLHQSAHYTYPYLTVHKTLCSLQPPSVLYTVAAPPPATSSSAPRPMHKFVPVKKGVGTPLYNRAIALF